MDILTVRQTMRALTDAGFQLEVRAGTLHLKGTRLKLSEQLKASIAYHKHALLDAFWPTMGAETLPDVILIPASVPNTLAALLKCIDSQRIMQPVVGAQMEIV